VPASIISAVTRAQVKSRCTARPFPSGARGCGGGSAEDARFEAVSVIDAFRICHSAWQWHSDLLVWRGTPYRNSFRAVWRASGPRPYPPCGSRLIGPNDHFKWNSFGSGTKHVAQFEWTQALLNNGRAMHKGALLWKSRVLSRFLRAGFSARACKHFLRSQRCPGFNNKAGHC